MLDSMGEDLTPARAARMSFDAFEEDRPVEKDVKLIKFLAEHGHSGCFEHQIVSCEIYAPMPICMQIMRHRTFCIAAGAKIQFYRPSDHRVYTKKIEDIARSFDDPAQRARLCNMRVRCVDEQTNKLSETRIENAVFTGMKETVELTLSSGEQLTLTPDHKVWTTRGWVEAEEAFARGLKIGTARRRSLNHVPQETVVYTDDEVWAPLPGSEGVYDVSNHGNLRSWINTRGVRQLEPKLKKLSLGKNGYLVTNLRRVVHSVHTLVARAFHGEPGIGQEVRHLDGNRLNNHVNNLAYGSSQDDSNDMVVHETVPHLTIAWASITAYIQRGIQPVYDISVSGPNHSFVANGVVVHNCYNMVSRRYTSEMIDFFIPEKFAQQAKSNKQASDGFVPDDIHWKYRILVEKLYDQAELLYSNMILDGVSREEARFVLPQALYGRFIMTGNLRNWAHFVKLRTHSGAQKQVRFIATEVEAILSNLFPESMKALTCSKTPSPETCTSKSTPKTKKKNGQTHASESSKPCAKTSPKKNKTKSTK
jgi:thymidylate synthase ThyX